MVNGHLRCLGSVQHLKNKYGEGYSLQFRLKNAADADLLVAEMKGKFPEAILKVKRGYF